MKVGETKDIKVTMSDQYSDEKYQGKEQTIYIGEDKKLIEKYNVKKEPENQTDTNTQNDNATEMTEDVVEQLFDDEKLSELGENEIIEEAPSDISQNSEEIRIIYSAVFG